MAAIQVPVANAAYNLIQREQAAAWCQNRRIRTFVAPERRTHLDEHQGRICGIQDWQASTGEQALDGKRSFESNVEEEHGGAVGRCGTVRIAVSVGGAGIVEPTIRLCNCDIQRRPCL
jgi:hypothetical protein